MQSKWLRIIGMLLVISGYTALVGISTRAWLFGILATSGTVLVDIGADMKRANEK